MKIGTLTFHKTTNYGAILQTYALQKYINDMDNIKCEVIDYQNKTIRERYDKNPFNAKNMRQLIKRLIFYKNNVILEKKFNNFINSNINISNEKYTELDIAGCETKYDKFIAGSDQIWNLSLSGNDENYFMCFSKDKIKNNSYAASLGVSSIDSRYEEKMRRLLDNVNKISVREKEAVNILENILPDREIEQSLDPVFLLDKEQWLKIKSNETVKEKYILVYQIAITPNLLNFARDLSNKTGYKIYYISSNNKKIRNAKNINTASPEDFINYVYNAEYIVTSSFHGFAMATIFEKNVYYDLDDKKGNFSSRLYSLAKLINIVNRRIKPKFEENSFQDINYNEVYKLLNNQIEKSKKYINSILIKE